MDYLLSSLKFYIVQWLQEIYTILSAVLDMFLKMLIDNGPILILMVMATSHGMNIGTEHMVTCQVWSFADISYVFKILKLLVVFTNKCCLPTKNPNVYASVYVA